MDEIAKKLDQARRSLLDLTRRNRLINFKPRGRTSLQIVDEIPAEVVRILVANQKMMQFLPLEESEAYRASNTANLGEDGSDLDEAAGLPLFDLPEPDDLPPEASALRVLLTAQPQERPALQGEAS